VAADGRRLPVLLNSVLLSDDAGEPKLVRTTVFDARERQSYERELVAARDRERLARERTERLQRITALLAAAPDDRAVGSAVVGELAQLGVERAAVSRLEPESGGLHVVASHGPIDGGAATVASEPEFGEQEVRLPLLSASGLQGMLWLGFAEPRSFTRDERGVLLACAAQTALALERSRLYEQTRDVASVLQRSLLADEPPRDERIEVATRYEPAVEHLEVGGDWYDAFTLGRDCIGIVVGDVVGRGLGAATAMGQLRSALRALAGADRRPAEVLEHLDTFVAQVEPARFATVAYAEVDLGTGEVAYASAGHLPPVLLGPGVRPHLFMEGRSPPLGVPEPGEKRAQGSFTLARGASFLLYTDGLVERRTEPIDAGLERLLAAVAALGDPGPGELADTLPAVLIEHEAPGDDVCLLAFRFSRLIEARQIE
jgi:serine phosphatase RsbU (regulator of sigma subunit)